MEAPDPKPAGDTPPKMTDAEVMTKVFGPDTSAQSAAALKEKIEQPKAEEADDNPPTKPADEGTDAAEEPEDPELERAWAALERDGWRKSEIKKLGVATIKELGLKRARNQEEVDRAYGDLKTLKSKLNEKPKAEANTDSVAAKDDLSKALDAFAPQDPEAAKVLKPLLAEVNSLKQTLQERAMAEAQREAARIRGLTEGVYPEVKGDVAWNAVLGAAQRIAEEKDLDDAQTAVNEALKAVYGERKPAKVPVKADRMGDTPEAPTRKTKTPPATKDERALAAFDVITSPTGSRDDALKVFRR